MSKKSKRQSRKTSRKNKINKRRYTRKNRLVKGTTLTKNNLYGRGKTDKTNCCMCGKEINTEVGLIPRKCLIKHGAIRAHRICQDCWWDPVDGFAKEGTNHDCPGCVKGLPLNGHATSGPVLVDLTED